MQLQIGEHALERDGIKGLNVSVLLVLMTGIYLKNGNKR